MTVRNKNWVLTQDAFDCLLARFDADRERAGQKYETLRQKLIKFFEWRGCSSPADNADETMNRVSRKLENGERISNIEGYVAGVARMLCMEFGKEQARERAALEQLSRVPKSPAFTTTRRLECCEQCLQTLPEGSRELILEYYQGEKHAKIEKRRELAQRWNIPSNALRSRAFRLRARLEECVRDCLRQQNEMKQFDSISHLKVGD